MRSSACWSWTRAAARSTESLPAPSSARSASRRASCARSTSISLAMSAVSAITTTRSGRTWRKPPTIANDSSDAPFRIRSSPTPSIETSGAWCGSTPSSPSTPGSWTESTVSEYARRSGVTISSWSGMATPSSGRAPAGASGGSSESSSCRQFLSIRANVVDRARQEEGLLGQRVGVALEDLLERGDGVLDRDVRARSPREHLGDRERLAREPLEATRSGDGGLVLLGQLVDAEDRDDVLEVAVALQDPLRLLRDVVVLLADHERVEHARGRGQRIDRGVDAELGDAQLEADRRVEMRERRRRRGVGVVVRRDEDRLERGDRARLGRGHSLLETGHLGREVRLIADSGRHPAEECRHLGARLGEPEDVVDEEEDVAALLVAEVLGHRQAGQADPLAGAGRLVHLAEHEGRALDDAGLRHLGDQVVALAAALADAREHGHAGVLGRDVVDQLLDDHRLADAGPTEDADLAALPERADEVDDLEPGLEHLDLGRLLVEGGRVAVDRKLD